MGTPLHLPRGLPYPITIQRIHSPPSTRVKKTQQLLSYAYSVQNGELKEREVRVWESPIEGLVENWCARVGDVLRDSNDPIVYISEPCTHDVQLHGLCALCGKDLTQVDYTGFSDTSRAAISMVHDVGGLTVSLNEANRLETATTERLKASKKLSLIVDLDQTIVHATVDPTVGEWLSDPKNPNYKALEGTSRFRLGENPNVEAEDGCWYYVKMRPGLQKFLLEISQWYEMHVYTMGTRAYASEVCKVIDPTGAMFGGRILSRDESGSITRKSLQRLFPCDTSMVVIIDDRADVWDGSPNLVKVVPYDFFVGIGDINAAFLPKKKELTGAAPPSGSSEEASESPSSPPSTSATTPKTTPSDVSWIDPPPDIAVTSEPTSTDPSDLAIISPSLSEASASAAATIHAQIEDRPLSSRQAAIDAATASESDSDLYEELEAVLKDDDDELDRVFDILKNIRDQFFADTNGDADVKTIIPSMKRRVLQGVNLVFSGVVAIGSKPEDSEHWKAATLFGAKCSADLTSKTTHVVANQDGTAKVHTARRKGIQVVWTKWLLDSIALWDRQTEENYLIADPSSSRRVSTTSLTSLPPGGDSEPPSPSSSNLDVDEVLEPLEIDWASARNEVDDFLDETDDDETGSRDGGDGEGDEEVEGGGSGRGDLQVNGGGRKRSRANTESDEEDGGGRNGGPSTSNGTSLVTNGRSNGSSSGGEGLLAGSPLQKRVKTSRSRRSRLNLSIPLGEGAEEEEEGLSPGSNSPSPSPQKPPSSSNGHSPRGEEDSRPGSVAGGSEIDSDEEAFFASMIAEVERGLT